VSEVGGSDHIGFFRSGHELIHVTYINTEMEMKQMMAFLQLFEEKMMSILDAHHKSLMASLGLTEANTEKIEQDPRMMQSVEEHQDIPTEDIAVMPVGEPRKQRRVWKSTAGRRGEPKELTRGNHGSRRRLAAACRKVSHHATVARQERNLIRKIWTDVNCGPRSTLAAASRRMTHSTKMARDTEHGLQEQGEDNITPRTREGRAMNNKRLKNTQRKSGIRDRGIKRQQWQLRGKAGIKEPCTRQQLRLKIKRMSDMIDGKTFRLEMVKQANETSSWLRRIRIWTLWRSRPPPKWRKELQAE
jgi:hypothetical protein